MQSFGIPSRYVADGSRKQYYVVLLYVVLGISLPMFIRHFRLSVLIHRASVV